MNTLTDKVISLSGIFDIVSDPDGKGEENGFANAVPSGFKKIVVPGKMPLNRINYDYSYSSVFPNYHGFVWYYKTFDSVNVSPDERVLIEFERVGYLTDVYLNGEHLCTHRHHEEAFCVDITDKIKSSNLLAVRVFEPMRDGEPIMGIKLRDIPNGSLAEGEGNGQAANVIGGIIGEVRLKILPNLYITDEWVCPDAKTGHIRVTISVTNADIGERNENIFLLISEMKTGLPVTEVNTQACFPVGDSEIVLECDVKNYKLWELNNPFLYYSQVRIGMASHTVRFGFREIRFENGFFTLNGRRFLLKCAHGTFSASNCISMKALGFNAFRSIHRTMDRETMDLCDELGFLIIESPITSWGMREHENTRAMVRDYTANMVKMHRNHPSVGAYYFYNETTNNNLIKMAVDLLPEIRALDTQNIFLLGSARWDDMIEINSASNPGSYTFDTPLGAEGIGKYDENWAEDFRGIGLSKKPMGDLHPYAYFPLNSSTRSWFRSVGRDSQPVFLSEFGFGSQINPVSWAMNAEALSPLRDGFPENTPFPEQNVCWVLGLPPRNLWEDAESFLDKYNLRGMFPFTDLLCTESDRLNGRQREKFFDLIRSNPNVCGFSLTSFGGGNEGLCEGTPLGNGIVKESVAHAVQHSLSPLRFSLFATDRTVYADRVTELEAVLCNEDYLPCGSYPMAVIVDGENRVVKTWQTTAEYPKEGKGGLSPLAVTVFKDSVVLENEGEYFFRARLLKGDMPCGGNLKIRAVKITNNAVLGKKISSVGLNAKTQSFLEKNGVDILPLGEANTILVGSDIGRIKSEWDKIISLANDGATVVFLDERFFRDNPDMLRSIIGEDGRIIINQDWLYHNDSIQIPHPVFENMTPSGIVDAELFGPVYPTVMFNSSVMPLKAIGLSFLIFGYFASGINFGEYALGRGKAVLNGYQICENINTHPFADRMLLNIVGHYAK